MNAEGMPNIVVPTCRDAEHFEKFLEHWCEEFKGCHVIILEDRKKSILKDRPMYLYESKLGKLLDMYLDSYEVHDWRSIEKDLGKDAWIISRKSCAIKSYGIYRAWKNKALFTVLLDDDTRPERPGHIKEFYNRLFNTKFEDTPREDFYSTLKKELPRGTPHGSMARVGVIHGGWLRCADLTAEDQIKNYGRYGRSSKNDFNEGTIPEGVFYSMCGMNLAFRTELSNLMYFGLNGHMKKGKKMTAVPVNRCDDIWAGFFSKPRMDKQYYSVYTGEPYVIHERASNVWESRKAEKRCESMTGDFLNMMRKGASITPAPKEWFPNNEAEYWNGLAEAYKIWEALFKNER